jgi:hypothetical protein
MPNSHKDAIDDVEQRENQRQNRSVSDGECCYCCREYKQFDAEPCD